MSRSRDLAWLVVCASCVGTEVGNPGAPDGGGPPDGGGGGTFVDIDVSFTPAGAAARRALDDGDIDSAWVGVERVRLRSADNCDGSDEVELRGPYEVDMLAPGAAEPLTGIELPFVRYCRFVLRWDDSDDRPAEAPPELAGASFAIRGTRGDGTPFVLRSDVGDEIRLDAVSGGGFTVDDATHALIVGLDPDVLFAGVNLDAAEVGGDGTIRVDDDHNDELLDVFEDNLDAAADLYDDDDDDGELAEDEAGSDDVLAN